MVFKANFKDKFSSEIGKEKRVFTCFIYDTDESLGTTNSGIKDGLFVGTLCGRIASFPIAQRNYGENAAERQIDPIYFPEKHYSQITCLAVSHILLRSNDGVNDAKHECVLSGSMDRTVKIWAKNIRDGLNYTCIQTLTGHSGKITSLVTTPHEGLLSCSLDGTIRLFTRCSKPQAKPADEMVSNMRYYLYECTTVLGDTKAWLTSMVLLKAISPFGNWTAYVSTSDGDILIYRSAGTTSILYENKHPPVVKYNTWSKVHPLEITMLLLIQSQSYIITLSNDGTSKILDSSKGNAFFSIQNPSCRYTSVQWLHSNNYLVYSDEAGTLELVSLNREKSLSTIQLIPFTSQHLTRTMGLSLKLPLIGQLGAYKMNNTVLVLQPNTLEIILYDLDIQEDCIAITGHASSIVGIATFSAHNAGMSFTTTLHQKIDPHEMPMFSIETQGVLKCWDDYDDHFRFEVREKSQRSEVTCMQMLWSMNCVATGHDDGAINLWNLSTTTFQRTLLMRGAIITTLTVAPVKATDVMLLAGDSKGRVSITNLVGIDNKKTSGELSVERVFQGYHEESVDWGAGILALAYHENYGVIISGGEDRSLRLWRMASNRKALKVTGHEYGVSSVFCCVTERLIITGDEGGFIKLWRIAASTEHDCGIALEVLFTWDPLTPLSEAIDYSLPNTNAILSCVMAPSGIFLAHSSQNANYLDIWKIATTADVSDAVTVVDTSEGLGVSRFSQVSHPAYVPSVVHLNMRDETNPLSCNRLFIGCNDGLVVKYLL